MRRSLLAPAVAVVLLAPAGHGTAAQTRTQTIRLISTPTSQTIVDVAPKAKGPGQLGKGDIVRATSSLENAVRQLGKAKGIVVGYDSMAITVVKAPKARATVHVTLPGGTLTARGAYDLGVSGTQRLQIVGGTGAFKGARGTASSSDTHDGRYLNVYILRLP
jgi:hypothetical protein